MRRLVDLREEERRPAGIAFLTLMGIMAGHALLETARDALFLASLPAAHLPFVYIAVAGVAWLIAHLEPRLRPNDCASALSGTLVLAAGVTALFWLLLGEAGRAGLYVLYVWSAIVASLAVAGFWLMLSERFTVTQAKRVYALVGTAGVLGAVCGAAIAGLLAARVPARYLLLAAAVFFAVASLGPRMLSKAQGRIERVPSAVPKLGPNLPKNPYVKRLAILGLLAATTFTVVDYAFKSTVAAHVPAAELGEFLALTYLALNVLSLVAQLALVQRAIQVLGVTGALVLLPLGLLGGGVGLFVTAGLLSAMALKGLDGTLRYSLHRTSVELLYVPMSDRARARAKTTIDVVIQRGAQALGSVGILLALWAGASPRVFGVAVAVLCLAWLAVAMNMRKHYLDLFRQTLQDSAAQPKLAFPELDLSSLESIIATLNSSSDLEVIAALDYLQNEGRARLIPALILYHPSPEVVVHALGIFAQEKREDFLVIAERLLDRPEVDVRAAALRAVAAVRPKQAQLERFLDVDCRALSLTALVGLVASNWLSEDEAERRLDAALENGSPIALTALAKAIAARPAGLFEDVLIRLGKNDSVPVKLAALRAMARAPTARYLSILMHMLPQRELRGEARTTLVAMGDTALSYLTGALADENRSLPVRRHLPRTIMRFDASKAAPALLAQFAAEKDGLVRYKLLRALGKLRVEHPDLAFDSAVIDELIKRTVSRIYELVEWRAALEVGAGESDARKTDAQELLVQLLLDKETNGIERLFRLIGLGQHSENIETIYRGLRSRRADVRASSRELLESLLSGPLRDAVLGLVDEAPAKDRLRAAGPFHSPVHKTYETALHELIGVNSESIRSLTMYHAAELGLSRMQAQIEATLETDSAPASRRIAENALDLLRAGPKLVQA